MKETALVHMEVPEEARRISGEPVSRSVDLTNTSADMKTSTFLRWLSCNYIGTAVTTAGFFASDALASEALLVTTSLGATALFVSVVGQSIGVLLGPQIHRNIKKEVEKQGKPIEPDEWKSLAYMMRSTGDKRYSSYAPIKSSDAEKGIRIRHRGVRNARITAFLPIRMFKKQLVSETVWYEPRKDSFYRESHYMGFAHYTKVTEEFAGRRQSFKTALESL